MSQILAKRSTHAVLLALCAIAVLVVMFNAGNAEAIGNGCPWGSHTEIDYFDNPQKTGVPVAWKVFTCNCNIYSSGTPTPYYTIISETPCPGF